MKNMLFALLIFLVATTAFADGSEIVVTADGFAVYTFDVHNGSASQCYDRCATTWPPVVVSSAEGLTAPIGTTQRTDGSLQLTLDGKPAHLFACGR